MEAQDYRRLNVMPEFYIKCPECRGEKGHRHLTGAWITCTQCGGEGRVPCGTEPGHEHAWVTPITQDAAGWWHLPRPQERPIFCACGKKAVTP